MADWKGVRKETRSREDRRQSSELHRKIRSRSSTPGSDSQLEHSAHMKRKRRESSSPHFKRKRRRSSSSRSRSLSGDRKDKSRKSQPSVKSKKGKRDYNSSECTRHVTGATKSEHKHRKQKRKYSSPSSDSSSDSDSSDIYSSGSSVERRRRKKHTKREKHSHRLKKSARKKHKLKSKRKKRSKTDSGIVVSPAEAGIEGPHPLPAKPKQQELSTCAVQSVVPVSGKSTKMRGPMTKEEWEKQQSVVRRVYDPDTGRHRLVKGDGEIIEEIVSREQQKAINKQATLGDGLSFQAGLSKYL